MEQGGGEGGGVSVSGCLCEGRGRVLGLALVSWACLDRCVGAPAVGQRCLRSKRSRSNAGSVVGMCKNLHISAALSSSVLGVLINQHCGVAPCPLSPPAPWPPSASPLPRQLHPCQLHPRCVLCMKWLSLDKDVRTELTVSEQMKEEVEAFYFTNYLK